MLKFLIQKWKLFFRVQSFMNTGIKYAIVDPDPGQSYSRSKKAKCHQCSKVTQTTSTPIEYTDEILLKAPKDGWGKATCGVPNGFSYLSISNFARKSGKKSAYVEKPLEKGYKFFFEGYVHNVTSVSTDQYCYLKAKCFRSQRKNQQPHQINVAIDGASCDIMAAKCSCVAGSTGYCNHVIGLLYLVDHSKKMQLTEFPQEGTCTDNPQQWHRPRTKGINPEPVMSCSVIRPAYSKRPVVGIKPSIYEARGPEAQQNDMSSLIQMMSAIDPSLGICNLNHSKRETVQTSMGFHASVGSVLSYQLAVCEGDFSVTSMLSPSDTVNDIPDKYPALPLNSTEMFQVKSTNPQVTQYLQKVQVNKEESIKLERDTLGQNTNQKWYDVRKERLTCSTFGLILQRKTVTDKFLKDLVVPKNIAHVPAIKYGLDNESKALERYTQYMKNIGEKVTVEPSGCIINPAFPWIAGSPDAKVISSKAGVGIVEVKCSYSNRQITPKDACNNSSFFCQSRF